MTYRRALLIRLGVVGLAVLLAWKTLITHTDISWAVDGPHTAGDPPALCCLSHHCSGKQRAHSHPGRDFCVPDHLEDLRVFRKADTEPTTAADCLPCGPDQSQGTPGPLTAASEVELPRRAAESPLSNRFPLVPPALLRAQLQMWRV